MLGWHVSVYRLPEAERDQPASTESEHAGRLAVWQTGVGGLDWLNELAKEGKIFRLGGNGYPSRYTGKASALLPRIGGTPPAARDTWLHDPGDILGAGWAGQTAFDETELALCAPDEWLIVDAWDES